MAFECTLCKCVHGFEMDNRVKKITRHHITSKGKDIWYCPNCGHQHTSADGLEGMPQKNWREVDCLTFGDRVIVCDAKLGAYTSYEGVPERQSRYQQQQVPVRVFAGIQGSA